MNTKPTKPQLTDSDLNRALAAGSDSLVPSSGFAVSVMTAVYRETAAPAPIPFPWKRALPGVAGAVVAIAFLIAAIPSALRMISVSEGQAHSVSIDWQTLVGSLAHHPDALALAIAVVIPLTCLFFCRRLIAAR